MSHVVHGFVIVAMLLFLSCSGEDDETDVFGSVFAGIF